MKNLLRDLRTFVVSIEVSITLAPMTLSIDLGLILCWAGQWSRERHNSSTPPTSDCVRANISHDAVTIRRLFWAIVVLDPGVGTFKVAPSADVGAEQMGLPVMRKEVGKKLAVDAAETAWGFVKLVWRSHVWRIVNKMSSEGCLLKQSWRHLFIVLWYICCHRYLSRCVDETW